MQLAQRREKLKSGMPTDGMIIVVGLPKSGKTSLAASIQDSLLIEMEKGGADRVAGRIQDVGTLDELREVLKAAVAEPSIKAIAIDSVDVLSDLFENEVARAAGLANINERKAGVDGFALWADLRRKFESLVSYLKASDKLIVLVAHCREPKLDADGKLISPAGINTPGKIGGYLAAQADAIGHCFKKQIGSATQYFISFQGGPLGIWGSRIPELEVKIVQLPRENPWSAIEAVFKAEPKPAEAKPATKPQGGLKK